MACSRQLTIAESSIIEDLELQMGAWYFATPAAKSHIKFGDESKHKN